MPSMLMTVRTGPFAGLPIRVSGGATRRIVDPEGIARWQDAMLRQAEDALQRGDERRLDHLESIIVGASLGFEDVCTAFGSGHAFLGALLKRAVSPMLEPLGRCESAEAFRNRLFAFGVCAAEHCASRYLRNLHQVALTECIRNAEIGCDLYLAGPGWLEEELARFIEAARVSGFVQSPEDSHHLAGALIALLTPGMEDPDAGARESVDHEAIARTIGRFHGSIRVPREDGRVG